MLFLVRVENVTNGQTHIGGLVENVTNGQTHIGEWVKNVTNGRTHSKNGDVRTDGHTESSFLR